MRTVLVVESDFHVRALIAAVLTRANYRVAVSEDLGGIIAEAALAAPDAILLDADAGGPQFGFDLLVQLRRNTATEDTAIVLMTGMTDADTLARLEGDSATLCLEKPFSRRELLQAVASACGSRVSPGNAPPVHLYSV